MISSLEGTVTTVTDQAIVVSVSGIGYLVAVPNTAMYTLGATTLVHTYLAVRETALDLYGFPTADERALFERLLLVPKVGPKSALGVMRLSSSALLLESIAHEDPSRLQKLSGIGKKTAENIVAALKGKVDDLYTQTSTDPVDAARHDVVDALIALGFDESSARAKAREHDDSVSSVSDIIKKALQ